MHQRPNFGVHSAGGVAFLIQRAGVSNALGVDIPSPFEVPPSQYRCPHHIVIPASGLRHPQVDDPLFQAMSPVPGKGIYSTSAPLQVIRQLEKLSSPVEDLSIPYWYLDPRQTRARIGQTNCAPLVLTGVTLTNIRSLRLLTELYETQGHRRVLLVVDANFPRLPGITPIKTQISEVESPETLREAGATLLTEFMISGKAA